MTVLRKRFRALSRPLTNFDSMPTSPRFIKQKITSVSGIKKITRTMEMVAAAKMRKAIDQALGTREYAAHTLELLSSLAGERHFTHPLFTSPAKGRDVLVVLVASNKGLCGGYNAVLSRALGQYLKAHKTSKPKMVVVGKHAEKIALRQRAEVIAKFHGLGESLDIDDVHPVVEFVREEFLRGTYHHVVMIYAHFESTMTFRSVARKLLPIKPRIVKNLLEEIETYDLSTHVDIEEKQSIYTLEPANELIADYVLKHAAAIVVYQSLLEAFASEQSARRLAMKSATDSADDMISGLTLSYNRARQSLITQEIAEISAGAEAITPKHM